MPTINQLVRKGRNLVKKKKQGTCLGSKPTKKRGLY